MPTGTLRVEYNVLNDLSKAFAQESLDIEQMIRRLSQDADQLYRSGWSGRAADSFYREAADVTIPATSKLASLLQETGDLITACLKIFYEADQEVGKLFQKEMAGSAPAAKQGYDPNEGVKTFWSSFGSRWLGIGAETATGLATTALLGPLGMVTMAPNLAKGMANAYKENGGGLLGVLGAVNVLNPVSHLMETAYTADAELDKAFYLDSIGDHTGAMKHFQQGGASFADSTKAAIDTGMTAAGGAKFGAKFFEGEGTVAAEAGAKANDRLFTPQEIDEALDSNTMRSGTPVEFSDANGPLRGGQTPSENIWYHERVEVPGAGPQGQDVAIRTHSPNPNAPEGSFSESHYTTQVDTIQNNPRHVVDVDANGNLLWKTWKQMSEGDKAGMHWPAE